MQQEMQQDQRIEEFWKRFLEDKKLDPNTKYLESFHFELTEKWANELLRLVLEGKKRATASSLFACTHEEQNMPKVGDYSIVTDWDGNPKCVIETTAVQIMTYSEMTFDICKREGEDDNLESWKQGHQKFFTEEGKEMGYEFSEDMPIVFEDFQVVYQEEEHKLPIRLEKIVYDNIWKIIKLHVKPDQENFVATNTESILEAYATIQEGHVALPFGLYQGTDLIGFVMIGYGTSGGDDEPSVAKESYCIWRFMIDENFQGKGLGKAAMQAVLDYIQTKPCGEAKYCWLSYEEENAVARNLYTAFGFKETGEICYDEIVSVKTL